jgi:hypothetical protein
MEKKISTISRFFQHVLIITIYFQHVLTTSAWAIGLMVISVGNIDGGKSKHNKPILSACTDNTYILSAHTDDNLSIGYGSNDDVSR